MGVFGREKKTKPTPKAPELPPLAPIEELAEILLGETNQDWTPLESEKSDYLAYELVHPQNWRIVVRRYPPAPYLSTRYQAYLYDSFGSLLKVTRGYASDSKRSWPQRLYEHAEKLQTATADLKIRKIVRDLGDQGLE